jgi:DNA-binding LytR/AlgR family response regulator
MQWKCLLVDDEPLAIEVLKNHIDGIEYLKIVGSCNNAIKAAEFLQVNEVDLMFLDIQMPKLDGAAFLRTLSHPPKVIFTTAYKEYAVEAFELDVVDYLLKPISLERLLKAVNKATSVVSKQEELKPVSNNANGFIYFRSDRKMVKVFYHEIIYIESLKDYIKIYRDTEAPLVVKQSITTTEEMLPGNLFSRVHRSFIVAINKVTAITHQDVEIGRIEIPIGRMYKGSLQSLLDRQ